MKKSDIFYEKLPIYTSQSDWFDTDKFVPYHEKWYLIIVDITSSTKAIESGRYKDVNMAGALSIIALLNETTSHELPFVFGGDGATILVPRSLYEVSRRVLSGCAYVVEKNFELNLRVGIIALEKLYAMGETLSILKYQTTPAFSQAIFHGTAIDTFDSGLKSGRFQTIEAKDEPINLNGLECRWTDIEAPKDKTLSIVIEVLAKHRTLYPVLLNKIDHILGDSNARNALTESNLNTSKSVITLQTELKAKSQSPFKALGLLLGNIIGTILMKYKLKMFDTDWGRYKNDVIHSTDAEKFDGKLQMVVTANQVDIVALERMLDILYSEGKIYFGIHQSTHALLTCLVYERNGAQVHFVDAANGGYTKASQMMKTQKLQKKMKQNL
jgi:hypothetical protein